MHACSVVLAGILISAMCDPLRAADVMPEKPSAEKSSAGETKEDNPAAKAKDAALKEQIDKLIEQLGDKDYYVRQRAQNELARLSFDAFDALTAATTNDDLEIASRAKYILRSMRVEWMAKNDPPEVKEKLKDYELQPEDARQARMHDLAVMSDGKGISALCRLITIRKVGRAFENRRDRTAQIPFSGWIRQKSPGPRPSASFLKNAAVPRPPGCLPGFNWPTIRKL